MLSDAQSAIMHALTDEIVGQAKSLASEQRHPGMSADESDQYMREKKNMVLKLRAIRSELEELFTGALL